MISLAFLRHGTTDWNIQRRVQGRTDIGLSEPAHAWLSSRAIPEALRSWTVVSSPLRRARETACLLGLPPPRIEPAVAEMSWGEWEGCTLEELRARHGASFSAREMLGLDFHPPGGESPRLVQQRLLDWLHSLAPGNPDLVVISHKGVMRALLALAWDWNMRSPAPARIDWRCLQLVSIDARRRPRIERLNLPLAERHSPR
jgi:probable phosphoglycerate mutase